MWRSTVLSLPLYLAFPGCVLTARLDHDGEISGDGRTDSQGQRHDRKGDCPTPFRRGPAHDGAEDHGEREDVTIRKEGEVVVLDGQAPPQDLIQTML